MTEQSIAQFLPLPEAVASPPREERRSSIAQIEDCNEEPLAASRIRHRRIFWRLAIIAITIDVLIAALIGGLKMRSWVWDYTATGTRPLRSGDIQNGYHWGLIVYNNAGGDQNVDWRGRRSP